MNALLTHDWRIAAACQDVQDPEIFFPIGHSPQAIAQEEEAKKICRRCPVVERCRQWALETGQETGVWGGLAEDDRRALKGKPVQPAVAPQLSSRKNRSHRYPGYATAVDGILGTRLDEVRALVERRASVHEIATVLDTNMPTVRKVLERLDQPTDDSTEKIDHSAVNRFVQGFPVEVTDAEFLIAVQICVGRDMTLIDVDRLHGWERKTTENWVNRLRKRYQRASREFPSLVRPSVRTFSEREVLTMREKSHAGATDLELSMQFDCNRETVRAIVTGKRYPQYGGPIRAARSTQGLKTSRNHMCGHGDNSLAAKRKHEMGEAA